MAEVLDRAIYGNYHQIPDFSIDGCHIKWTGIPAVKHTTVMTYIREQAAHWMVNFDVEMKAKDDWCYLDVRFRDPTSVAARNIKGEVFGLLFLTGWGGP